jgi:hypothetical protein
MKARTGLGLSAAAVAWVCFSPGAFATGVAQPFNNDTYVAQTVTLSATGNTVAIVNGDLTYSTSGTGTTIKAGDIIVWNAPAGNTWTNLNAAAVCQGVANGPLALINGNTQLQCTVAGAATTFVRVTIPASNASPVSLTGPGVALLGTNIEVGQPSTQNPSPVLQITAQNTQANGGGTVVDNAPLFNLGLTSANLFSLTTSGQTLGIDLTGNGVTQTPPVPPGGGFNVTPASGTPINPATGQPSPTVSTAGFLGALGVNTNTNIDARNGLFLDGNDPLFTNGSLAGAVIVTLSGDFSTITSAYLIPNNAGSPSANMSACLPTPPGNSIAGTISSPGKNSIRFAGLGNPGNPALGAGSNRLLYGVCLVTNGTQVIQPARPVAINANATIGTGANAITTGLTAPNQTFGSIDYLGVVFFAQNVFGINNGSPTFFRMVNESNTAAPVWAVLTKDVPNAVPEVGAGSCTYQPAGSSSATLTAPPVPPGAVNPPTTCNISFVAKLSSQPGLPDTVSTNLATGGSAGFVQPNTATYVSGDDIAILAGTSLNPLPNQGSLHATVYLLSPNAGMHFSALTQSAAFGVLVQSP